MDARHGPSLYATSVSMVLVPFMAVLLLVFDPDPPVSPIGTDHEVVDCHNIFPGPVLVNQSVITFNVFLGDFVQIPDSVALAMLTVVNRVGNFVFRYNLDTFENVQQYAHNISFSVRQQMAALTESTIYCHGAPILRSQFRVSEIDGFPTGFSSASAFGHMTARLSDFCYINGSVLFFSEANGSSAPLVSSANHVIPVSLVSLSDRPSAPDCDCFPHPVVFISATPLALWRQLIDVLLPLWGSVYESRASGLLRVFLIRNQTYLLKNLKWIVSSPPLYSGTNGCFSDGHFLAAPGSRQFDQAGFAQKPELLGLIDQIHLVSAVNPHIIPAFRERFTNRALKIGRIVVDRLGAGFTRTIERLFPSSEIVVLPETDDLHVVADVIAEAHVFIACHISTIVFALFMSPGAALVEIQPDRLECTALGARWAYMARVRYIPARISENCDCNYTNLTCYMQYDPVYEGVSEEWLKMAVERGLEES